MYAQYAYIDELLGRQWLCSGAAATGMLGCQEWGDTHYFEGKALYCVLSQLCVQVCCGSANPHLCLRLSWLALRPSKAILIEGGNYSQKLWWKLQVSYSRYPSTPPTWGTLYSTCMQYHKWVVMACMNDPWLPTQLHWSLKHVSFLNWWHIAPAVHPPCHTSLQSLMHIIHI